MNPKSPTFCKMANIGFAIQNETDCCACNHSTQSFEDGKRNTLYLNRDGLDAMWNSPTRRIIAKVLDYGKKIECCSACWVEEEIGVTSQRMRRNELLKDVEPRPDQPRVLNIKPTNSCNLACRTCQAHTSTSMYKDEYALKTEIGEFSGTFRDYVKGFEEIRLGLSKSNLKVWDTFEKWIPGLVFIDIYGGEPMYADVLWERLSRAAYHGLSSNTSLQFHTNGTIWNQSIIDTILKYKHTNIAVSIDSLTPAHNHYIRHNVDHSVVLKNLNNYIQLAKDHTNVTTNITYTISIYNVWYADTMIAQLKDLGIPFCSNIVVRPEQYDIRHIPLPIRKELISKFNDIPELTSLVATLKHTIPGCDIFWPKLWQEIEILDRLRGQKFSECFPEYYQALLPHIPHHGSSI